jgi:hypothetical protein
MSSGGIRAARENQSIIRRDACHPSPGGTFVADLFKSWRRLEAENLFLRHQLSIALRRAPDRLRLRGSDRVLMVWMTRIWPGLLDLAVLFRLGTLAR